MPTSRTPSCGGHPLAPGQERPSRRFLPRGGEDAPGRATAGFTLLEALVALAMLAGVTASVMTLIATDGRARADAEADLLAASQVRSLMARLGRDLPLEPGLQTGSFADERAWSIRTAPYDAAGEAAPPGSPLLLVRIVIEDTRRGGRTEFATLRRAPR